MKTSIISVIAFCCLVGASVANACSYHIDEVKKSAELQSVAVASLGEAKVLTTAVSKFSFFESKPTPMCPDEMTYNAVVTASFEQNGRICTVELAVKKVEPWAKSDLDTYTVEGRKNATCKE